MRRASAPSSAKRRLTPYTVPWATPKAWLTRGRRSALVGLEQECAPGVASRAEPFSARTICSSWLRSCGGSRTANISLSTPPPRRNTYCRQISAKVQSPSIPSRPRFTDPQALGLALARNFVARGLCSRFRMRSIVLVTSLVRAQDGAPRLIREVAARGIGLDVSHVADGEGDVELVPQVRVLLAVLQRPARPAPKFPARVNAPRGRHLANDEIDVVVGWNDWRRRFVPAGTDERQMLGVCQNVVCLRH